MQLGAPRGEHGIRDGEKPFEVHLLGEPVKTADDDRAPRGTGRYAPLAHAPAVISGRQHDDRPAAAAFGEARAVFVGDGRHQVGSIDDPALERAGL
jgi:hypothetical protein